MYYKISKHNADAITKFEYFRNCWFDPYSNPQKNGSGYIVGENIYEILKDDINIKKVNFQSINKQSNKDDDEPILSPV